MLFSSATFLFIFLPVCLFLYHFAHERFRLFILLLASCIFYFFGENFLIWVMFCTSTIDFCCARAIAPGAVKLEPNGKRTSKQKIWLAISIITNLTFLLYFKYLNFTVESLLNFCIQFNFKIEALETIPKIALPLGISFYIFQSMSYTIDVYRGEVSPSRNPLKFWSFIFMFPQLVAGPIVRYSAIERQLHSPNASYKNFADGVRRFLGGLSKKLLIADPLGGVADKIFALQTQELSTGIAWFGLLAYTLQIYFDFSGYSCMAIGLGKFFGFDFQENFNYPYCAKSVKDFWRRWHITLSTWFRDYVYIPLGGSRGSKIQTCRNLLIVFFMCGLWHGAKWNFVAWGLLHGFFILSERSKFGSLLERLPALFRHGYAVSAIMLGWLFFRLDTVSDASVYLHRMLFFRGSDSRTLAEFATPDIVFIVCVALIFSTPLTPFLRLFIADLRSPSRYALEMLWIGTQFALFYLCIASIAAGGYSPFLYFRF
jgi:alginate O-acetyltransferase complex protein AlgI